MPDLQQDVHSLQEKILMKWRDELKMVDFFDFSLLKKEMILRKLSRASSFFEIFLDIPYSPYDNRLKISAKKGGLVDNGK